MARRVLALTGTPGVGKSTLVPRLRAMGLTVLPIDALVRPARATAGWDRRRRAQIVDTKRIDRYLRVHLRRFEGPIVIEGHVSHLLETATHALVLRLRPGLLARRLRRRGWSEAKVRENVEAEAIDVILQEAVSRLGRRGTYEIDVGGLRRHALAQRVAGVARGNASTLKNVKIGRVKWSDEILRWF